MAILEQLTDRQREVYEFIRDKIRNRGYGPTVREIGGQFDISSPNGVMCHLKALEKKGMITREPNMSRAITLATENADGTGGLPLLGTIAAGVLHEAITQDERIDFSELFHADDLYVLKVKGESMIEDQIADGDYVVIKKQPTAHKGQTVVALTEDNEATLKRWYPEGKRVRLEPANKSMKPIYVTNPRVLGVVVGVVRHLK
ncbi:MAG TPA: transcriptional repressor LexA [Pirellulales bacterium]|nr:transcriptional repressor LexA [Pirellulales bacterium]